MAWVEQMARVTCPDYFDFLSIPKECVEGALHLHGRMMLDLMNLLGRGAFDHLLLHPQDWELAVVKSGWRVMLDPVDLFVHAGGKCQLSRRWEKDRTALLPRLDAE